MVVDSLYLENLEELVNEENKIVTFKWLSSNLDVHVNQAKQMLYAFVDQERNKKDNDKLFVTYFVAGIPKAPNGFKTHKCFVVAEDELDVIKATLSSVTSCHVYSVQKVKLKDTNALYMVDCDSTKEKLYSSNSAIKYTKARSKCERKNVAIAQTTATSETTKTSGIQPSTKLTTNGTSKSKVKVEAKGSIATMFTAGSRKKADTSSRSVPQKQVEREKTKKKKDGNGSGMMSFFSKQSEINNKAEEKIIVIDDGKFEDEKNEEEFEEKKTTKKESLTFKGKAEKCRPVKGKKSTRISDSDDDSKPNKKRRKRIRNVVFDSSSEEEILETPPQSPVREASPEPSSDSPPSPDSTGDEIIAPTPTRDVEIIAPTPTGGRCRKSTRKLVPKTFMDDEGFMVTEKVWESDSTDVSEKEEKTGPSPVKQFKPSKAAMKRTSPQKKSPLKSGTRNQTSLMSFFNKK